MKAKHDYAGYGSNVAIAKFILWVQAQREFPQPEAVMARFNCAQATANRWLNVYEEASGMLRPRRTPHGQLKQAA